MEEIKVTEQITPVKCCVAIWRHEDYTIVLGVATTPEGAKRLIEEQGRKIMDWQWGDFSVEEHVLVQD